MTHIVVELLDALLKGGVLPLDLVILQLFPEVVAVVGRRLHRHGHGIAFFRGQTQAFGGQLVRTVRFVARLPPRRRHGVHLALQFHRVVRLRTTTSVAVAVLVLPDMPLTVNG